MGCRRKNFSNPNPKPKVQSNPFHFPAISRSQSCLSKITIIPFAGSGSSHYANPLLRARRISVGSGKFDFANRLNGVGEFAFCGGSRRDIAMLRHLRFPAVSPYLPARGKSPECAALSRFPILNSEFHFIPRLKILPKQNPGIKTPNAAVRLAAILLGLPQVRIYFPPPLKRPRNGNRKAREGVFLVCALPLRILFAPVSGFPIKITAS